MELKQILESALQLGGSDVFIIPGSKVMAKVRGNMVPLCEERVMPEESRSLISQAYALAQNRDIGRIYDDGDDDFSFSVEKMCRFRCNAYQQRGTLAATFRGSSRIFRVFIPFLLILPKNWLPVHIWSMTIRMPF